VRIRPPRIVFLDAQTVDLGDLDMSPIARQGRYQAYRLTPQDLVVRRARRAEIVITNKCLLRKEELAQLKDLKLICVAATGINNVDLEEAKKRGIRVKNVAGYSTTTVAEHTLMFLLALSHRLMEHHRAASERWVGSPFFAILDHPFADLAGKTLGIVGYGAIGKMVARLARALGMKILIAKIPGRRYPLSRISPSLPHRLPLNQLLRMSDFVTLHCPLTKETDRLINRSTLNGMKKGSTLLNLARGKVVDEVAVETALKTGRLAGYATDVLSEEPPRRNHPLLQKSLRDKVLLTPHIAWASCESRQRLVDAIGLNITHFKAET